MLHNPAEVIIRLSTAETALSQKDKEITELKRRLMSKNGQIQSTEKRAENELLAEKQNVSKLQQQQVQLTLAYNNLQSNVYTNRNLQQLHMQQAEWNKQACYNSYAALTTEHEILKQELTHVQQVKEDLINEHARVLELKQEEVKMLEFKVFIERNSRNKLADENIQLKHNVDVLQQKIQQFERVSNANITTLKLAQLGCTDIEIPDVYDENINVHYTRRQRELPAENKTCFTVTETLDQKNRDHGRNKPRETSSCSTQISPACETWKEGHLATNLDRRTGRWYRNSIPTANLIPKNGHREYTRDGAYQQNQTQGGYRKRLQGRNRK